MTLLGQHLRGNDDEARLRVGMYQSTKISAAKGLQIVKYFQAAVGICGELLKQSKSNVFVTSSSRLEL
jgi:hypothetical protein